MRKLSPSALLRQHLEHEVNRVSRRQEHQEVKTPQLRGAEVSPTTTGLGVRPLLAQKPVGHKGRELLEQCAGTGDRKQRIHAPQPTVKKRLRPQRSVTTVFSS